MFKEIRVIIVVVLLLGSAVANMQQERTAGAKNVNGNPASSSTIQRVKHNSKYNLVTFVPSKNTFIIP